MSSYVHLLFTGVDEVVEAVAGHRQQLRQRVQQLHLRHAVPVEDPADQPALPDEHGVRCHRRLPGSTDAGGWAGGYIFVALFFNFVLVFLPFFWGKM